MPLALLAAILLSPCNVLAGAADQQQHGEQVTNAAAANQHIENNLHPPARRHLTDSEDASARDKRDQMYVGLYH